MYLNKAFVIGNLTRDPELRSLPSGGKVTSFSVATNRTWKDKDGSKKEAVEYHNIVVFGRQAETSAQYLKRGQSVFIEGRLQTRSWDDKTSGQKKYRTEIVAEAVQFGPKSDGSARPQGQGFSATLPTSSGVGTPTPPAANAGATREELETIEYPEEESNPEDIPF